MLRGMSTTPPSTTATLPATFGHLIAAIIDWLAGELARNPSVLKLAGIGAVVAAAIPGDISNTVVRAVLIAAGAFLTAVVHLAEAQKKS